MSETTTAGAAGALTPPLGPRLRIARENAALTREDLARRVGVGVDSVAAWEEGLRAPRANRLVMLAGILDISLGWLLEGRESEYMETQGATTLEALRGDLQRLQTTLAEASAEVDNALARLDVVALRIRRGEADQL